MDSSSGVIKMYQLIWNRKENKYTSVLNTDTGSQIPFDEANTDYAQYLIWLSEGNTPTPADPIPEPVELTPQEKLASAGLTVDELKLLLGIAV